MLTLNAGKPVTAVLLRELAVTVALLFGVSLVIFLILYAAPGDPFAALLGSKYEQILQAQTERAGLDYASGILDVVDDGYGFMRRHGLLPSNDDVYVSSSQVRRFGLRIGDRVTGAVRAPHEGEKFWGLIRVDSVNGVDTDTARRRSLGGLARRR